MTDRESGGDWEVAPYPAPGYTGPPSYQQPTPQYAAPQHPAPQHAPQQWPAQPYGTPQYPTPEWPTPQYPGQQYPGQQWPAPQYPGQQWPAPQWGAPAWVPPRRSSRPGAVAAAALIAFTSACLTLVCTLFLAAFATLLTVVRQPDEMASTTTVLLQLGVAVLLVAGGSLALTGRWVWLLPANAALLVLSIVWLVRALGGGGGLELGLLTGLPVLFAGLAVASAVLGALPTLRRRRAAPVPGDAAPETAPTRGG